MTFLLHRMKFVLTGRLLNIIHVISPKDINKSTVFTSHTTTVLNEPFQLDIRVREQNFWAICLLPVSL